MPYVSAGPRDVLGGWVATDNPLVEKDEATGSYRPSIPFSQMSEQQKGDYNDAVNALFSSGYTAHVAEDVQAQIAAAEAAKHVTVTPALAEQYFVNNNIGWGDKGAAVNDALRRWAAAGSLVVTKNPDGSPGGIPLDDDGLPFGAPDYVRAAWAATYGGALVGKGDVPGAIAEPPPPPPAPSVYLQDGHYVDDGGNRLPPEVLKEAGITGPSPAEQLEAARREAAAAAAADDAARAAAAAAARAAAASVQPDPSQTPPGVQLVPASTGGAIAPIDDDDDEPSSLPWWVIPAAGVGIGLLVLNASSSRRR